MKPRRRELLKMRSRRSAMAMTRMSIGGVRRAAPILGPPSPSVLTGLTRCPISVSQSSQSSLFSLLLSWNQDQRMLLRVQGSGSKAFIGFIPALWTRFLFSATDLERSGPSSLAQRLPPATTPHRHTDPHLRERDSHPKSLIPKCQKYHKN